MILNVIDIFQNIREILSKWNLTIDQRQLHMFFKCAFLRIQTGHASYLGNVFGFEKVIDIEEHFDGYAKLKEVVDNSLDAVGRLHLVGGEGPLLLAQRGGAALEDDLLDNPDG